MGILFDENVALLSNSLGKRPRIRGNTGILDSDNQVNPNPSDGLPVGYTWFRAKGERTAIAVLNVSVTNMRANIPVIVEENDSGNLEIIKIDTEDALYTYQGYAPSMNMPDRIPEGDKWSISHKRVQELRLRLSTTGGLTLHVNEGMYEKLSGDLSYFAGGDIDLTANVPGTVDTKRIILIGITTATNVLTQSAATAVVNSTTPTETPYFTLAAYAAARNAAASGVLWVFGVPLFYGQTSFANTDDFVDLRPIMQEEGTLAIAQGGTGQVTQTAAFDALAPNTAKGDLIAYNGSDNVRLPVGTNGYTLRANSSASAGVEWSIIGATFEATLSTSDASVTPLVSYTVAELVGVTLRGTITAVKSDRTAAYGASFRVSFRRQTGGNVALVGAGYIEQEEDSGTGTPTVTFSANTGTQAGVINFAGIAAENWSVKCHYTITSL